MICASISPVLQFRQSRTPSHQPFRKSLTKNASQSVRLLASHHSGFPIQVIPSLPLSRAIRDLPRSPNHPFVQTLEKFDQNASQIPTLSRHASPLWVSPVYGAAITYGKPVPIEASNFPNVEEGHRLAYPTTGSLVLRANDRLRLFKNF
nr:hypothetical protein BSM_02030 [uncultured archaeon]